MSVDLGDSRTGIAICVKSELIATPISVITEKNFEKCLEKTAIIANEQHAQMIIVGYPINMNGTRGKQCKKCSLFAKKLKKITGLSVKLWDERFTTVSSHNYLNLTNTRGKKRKSVVDAVAAVIILESYLRFRRNSQ